MQLDILVDGQTVSSVSVAIGESQQVSFDPPVEVKRMIALRSVKGKTINRLGNSHGTGILRGVLIAHNAPDNVTLTFSTEKWVEWTTIKTPTDPLEILIKDEVDKLTN